MADSKISDLPDGAGSVSTVAMVAAVISGITKRVTLANIIALITKSDIGLGNVDNTSDSTKLAAFLAAIRNGVNSAGDDLNKLYNIALGCAKLAETQSFTKSQRVTPVALSYAAGSFAVDFALSNNFSIALTENSTLSNPTNLVAGQSGQITVTQNASVAKTLDFGSYWKSADGSAPTVSTTLSAVNLIAYYVNSTNHISFSLIKHGAE